MSKKVQVEEQYFKKHLNWLTALGIDIIPIENVWYWVFYKIYAFILLVYVYTYSLLEIIDIAQSPDFNSMTFGLSYSVTHILGAAKITILIVKKKIFHQMLVDLEQGYFKPNMNRGGEEECRLVNAAITRANLHADVFNTLVYLIIGIRSLYAIFDSGTYVEYLDKQMNVTITKHIRTLPYKAWFPVDLNKSPAYEIMFIVQTSCLILYGFYIGFLDSIVYGMMIHMNNQYIILRNLLNNYVSKAKSTVLRENPNAHLEVPLPVDLPAHFKTDPRLSAPVLHAIQGIVNHCAKYYLAILDYCDRIENEFCYLMLLQFLSSLYILCFQLFQLSLVSNYLSFDSISMCLYLILMMYQLFCYCWYGNEVMMQSSNISTDIYNSDWLVTNESTKKSLLLMMMRAQRPVIFTAGKFALLSLPTYMTIVRGSASYFMVLRQMQ